MTPRFPTRELSPVEAQEALERLQEQDAVLEEAQRREDREREYESQEWA